MRGENNKMEQNPEYKSPQQFAEIFKSMTSINNEKVWQKIYHYIDTWLPQNYSKLNYHEMKEILQANGFMNGKEIEILFAELKKAKANDVLGGIQEMKYQISSPPAIHSNDNKLLLQYGRDSLITELCDAYQSNDEQLQETSILCNILINKLSFPEDKRQKFYDKLLHLYVKKFQLNQDNFIKILIKTVQQQMEYKRINMDIDVDEIRNVALNYRNETYMTVLNGRIFKYKGKKLNEFLPSTKFAKIFQNVTNWDRKDFCKVYVTINKWQISEDDNINLIQIAESPKIQGPLNFVEELEKEAMEREAQDTIKRIRTEEIDDALKKEKMTLPTYIHKSVCYLLSCYYGIKFSIQ